MKLPDITVSFDAEGMAEFKALIERLEAAADRLSMDSTEPFPPELCGGLDCCEFYTCPVCHELVAGNIIHPCGLQGGEK